MFLVFECIFMLILNLGSVDIRGESQYHPHRSRIQQEDHPQEDEGYVWRMENESCAGKGLVRQAFPATFG